LVFESSIFPAVKKSLALTEKFNANGYSGKTVFLRDTLEFHK